MLQLLKWPFENDSEGQNGPSESPLWVNDLTVAYHEKPVLWGISDAQAFFRPSRLVVTATAACASPKMIKSPQS